MYLIKIIDNKVSKTILGDANYLSSMVDDEAGKWVVSSTNYSKGYNYDDGVFYAPRPYPSWILDSNYTWNPPIAKPTNEHSWDEQSFSWLTKTEIDKKIAERKYADGVQQHLDNIARSNGYDNIISACSYAGVENPFQVESQSFITWRANIWAECHIIVEQVESGTIAVPTESELIAMLPAFI